MLEKIKILLGLYSDEKDEALSILISMAKDEAIDYCNLKEYSTKLDSAIIQMVIEKYNRLGTEGTLSVSTSGVSEDYLNGYSKAIVTKLNKNRRVRCV